MTRYSQIAWARDGVGSGSIVPSGAWSLGEVDTGIRSAFSSVGLTDDETDLVLSVAYSYGSAGAEGNFINVANQHVTSFYVLPRSPGFGFGIYYDGYVDAQSETVHVFTANSPTDDAVRLGIMLLGAGGTDPPDTPSASEAVPGVAPSGGGFSASVWITIPAGGNNLGTLPTPAMQPVGPLRLERPDDFILEAAGVSIVMPAAEGGALPYTYTFRPVSLQPLPTGITFDADTRTVTVAPNTVVFMNMGALNLGYRVTDGNNDTILQELLAVNPLVFLNQINDITMSEGDHRVVNLPEAAGSVIPYIYSIMPDLPDWATIEAELHSNQRNLRLQPMAGDGGVYGPFTWTARDDPLRNAPPQSITATFSITVAPGPALALGPIADQMLKVGEPLDLTLSTATNGVMPYTYSIANNPPWSTVDNGVLMGTAQTEGTTTVTWTVTDAAGNSAEVMFDIVVEADLMNALMLPQPPNLTWRPSESSSATLTEASGGTGPYTYTLQLSDDEGSMNMPIPAWITFASSTRIVSATSPVTGQYYMVYSVTDSSSPQLGATREFLITVVSAAREWDVIDATEDGVQVWHYGHSRTNNPTRIGFVLNTPPLESVRGRTPESNEFITPSATWTCSIPADEIATAIDRYKIGDIVRIVDVRNGVVNIRHTGRLRSVVIDTNTGPVVRGNSLGLTAPMRDAYPFQFDLWNTDVRNAIIATLRAAGIRDDEVDVANADLFDRLAWFGLREDQGLNVIQIIRFLSERTQGGNSQVSEKRDGLLYVSGNTAGSAPPTAVVIPTVADVRLRKRISDEVVGISYDTWEWTSFATGTIFYDYAIAADVPDDDIRRLYKIPRPSPMGPYQQLPFRFEIELPDNLYLQEISSATTFPITNITSINVIRSRWDKVLIYGLGAPPGELTRIILRGSGAIATPRDTKYYPTAVGNPGPRQRVFGVIEPLGNYPTVSETDALAAAIALYERRQQGGQVFDVLLDNADDQILSLDAGTRVSFMWEGSQRIGYVRTITERRQGLRWQVRMVVDGER